MVEYGTYPVQNFHWPVIALSQEIIVGGTAEGKHKGDRQARPPFL